MMVPGGTIDLLCYIKTSGHIAMANRQGPVQVFAFNKTYTKHVEVLSFEEDHTRLITGICEVQKVASVVPLSERAIEPESASRG